MNNISTCIGNSNQGSQLVEVVNGKPTTTSNVIAVTFGKRHDTVLRAIRNLDCSPEFSLRNYVEASREVAQPNGGKATYTEYNVTRDGFSFLAMGFTGKEAAKWKEAYINAFNMMESEIHRIQYSVNRTDALTAEQAEQLRIAIRLHCDKLPKAQQGIFMKKGWSKLKAHFGVTYRKIPQFEFNEALSLIARHTTEWELVDAPVLPAPATLNGNYHFPLSAADTHARKERKIGTAWLSPANLLDQRNRALELEVVEQLEKDGYDVMGLKMRILALRDVAKLAEERRSEYESLSRSMAVMSEKLSVLSFHRGKCVQIVGSPDKSHPIDRHVYRDQLQTA